MLQIILFIACLWLTISYILGIYYIFKYDLDTFSEVIWALIIWIFSPLLIVEICKVLYKEYQDSKQRI